MSYAPQIRLETGRSTLSVLLRLFFGSLTAFLLTFGWLLVVVFVLSLLVARPFLETGQVLFGSPRDDPASSITMLVMVAGLALTTMLAAKLWQGRSIPSLFGKGARTLRHFVVSAAATFAVVALISALPLPGPGTIRTDLSLERWLFWLPFAAIAIAAQTGAEEIFFRGYLQSELAGRFRSPIVWLTIPAFLFGMAHFVPDVPPQNIALYIGWATLFGLLAGDLTARTGSIGAGWGFHFANNAVALLFVATPGTITGLALYLSERSLGEPITVTFAIFYDLAIILFVWVLIRRLLQV